MQSILPTVLDNTCKLLPIREGQPSLTVQGFLLGVGHIFMQHAYDRPQLSGPNHSNLNPRAKTGIHHKSHCQVNLFGQTDTAQPKAPGIQKQVFFINTAWPKALGMQKLRIFLSGRIFQGLRSYLLRVGQGLIFFFFF